MPITPTVEAQRAALKTEILAAVTPVTTVYEYTRFWRDEQEFNAAGKTTLDGKTRFYLVEFDRLRTVEREDAELQRFWSFNTWQITVYVDLHDADATSKTASIEVEKIRDRLRLNANVFGTPERPEEAERAAQLISFEAGVFMGVLCWRAVLELTIEGLENKS